MIIASYAGTPAEVENYLEGRIKPVEVWEPQPKRSDENWVEYQNRVADFNDRRHA